MLLTAALLAALATAAAAEEPADGGGPVLRAMAAELDRAFRDLPKGDAPVHFLAYRIYDEKWFYVSCSYGVRDDWSDKEVDRNFHVELRVGSPALDSSRDPRGKGDGAPERRDRDLFTRQVPIEDDEASLRIALWLRTERAYRVARDRLAAARKEDAVLAPREAPVPDFTPAEPVVRIGGTVPFGSSREAWEKRLKPLSKVYKSFPHVRESWFRVYAGRLRRHLVTSEGTRMRDEATQYRVYTTASALCDDGMKIWLWDGVETPSALELPDDAALEAMARRLAADLDVLRKAPAAEPFSGPALLRPRAAAVLLHELLGHNVEACRLRDENSPGPFARRIGSRILPEHVTIVDDPTVASLYGAALLGSYAYDDEGVASRPVVLVDKGVLRASLAGRAPARGAAASNGHGRCEPGYLPEGRQGTLIVHSTNTLDGDGLRALLLEEVRRQGKPYGLLIDELAGRFIPVSQFHTRTFPPMPLRVLRVYADGRPDEPIRGAGLTTTALDCLEGILAAGRDAAVFNGTCKGSSGDVPVSVSCPSLLLQTLEIERVRKSQERPPLTPPPLHDAPPAPPAPPVPPVAPPPAPETPPAGEEGGGK